MTCKGWNTFLSETTCKRAMQCSNHFSCSSISCLPESCWVCFSIQSDSSHATDWLVKLARQQVDMTIKTCHSCHQVYGVLKSFNPIPGAEISKIFTLCLILLCKGPSGIKSKMHIVYFVDFPRRNIARSRWRISTESTLNLALA